MVIFTVSSIIVKTSFT